MRRTIKRCKMSKNQIFVTNAQMMRHCGRIFDKDKWKICGDNVDRIDQRGQGPIAGNDGRIIRIIFESHFCLRLLHTATKVSLCDTRQRVGLKPALLNCLLDVVEDTAVNLAGERHIDGAK